MKMSDADAKKNASEQQAIIGTHNSDLQCNDCLLRYDDSYICGNVSRCEAYPEHKPQEVLDGGECNKYVKE